MDASVPTESNDGKGAARARLLRAILAGRRALFVCRKCGEVRSLVEATRDRAHRRGYRERCLACSRATASAHYRRARPDKHSGKGPVVRAAHLIVRGAIANGSLVRRPCEDCGAEPGEAHHDDYAKPLSVRWLCRRCHRDWHARNGEGANAEREVARA